MKTQPLPLTPALPLASGYPVIDASQFTSSIADSLPNPRGSINHQYEELLRWYGEKYDADEIAITTQGMRDGPSGFPDVLGAGGNKGALAWLHSNGVWLNRRQLDCLIHILRCEIEEYRADDEDSVQLQREMSKAFKDIRKQWKKTTTPGQPRDMEVVLVNILMVPGNRTVTEARYTPEAWWSISPHPALIHASQRLTGRAWQKTLPEFVKHYASDPVAVHRNLFWPIRYASPETSFDEPALMAFSAFGQETLAIARDWENLSDDQKNGVLLGAFGLASLLRTNVVLAPFAVIHPDLCARLRMTNAPRAMMLCAPDGSQSVLARHSEQLLYEMCEADILNTAEHREKELRMLVLPLVCSTFLAALAWPDETRACIAEYMQYKMSGLVGGIERFEAHLKEQLVELCGDSLPEAQFQPLKDVTDKAYALRETLQRSLDRDDLEVAEGGLQSMSELICCFEDKEPLTVFLEDFWDTAGLEVFRPSALQEHKERMMKAVAEMDNASLKLLSEESELFALHMVDALSQYVEPEQQKILEANQAIEAIYRSREQVSTEVQQQSKEAVAHQQAVADLQAEIEALEVDREHLEAQLEEAKAEAHRERTVRETLSQSQQQPPSDMPLEVSEDHPLYRAIGENATLVDVLDALPILFPAKVNVLDSARESAGESDYKQVHKVASKLMALCGPYRAAIEAGVPDSEARHILGKCYRPQESDSTLATPRLSAQREKMVNGKKVLFKQHLTLGVGGSQSCLHVHFKLIDGVMCIAHVGRHLDTSKS